ncbi:hypothetical protein [Rhodococcus tukisamuensis]|uniref:Uncharacterized protein n=1 Tax=Rhodococcus tukisamuensis TaxID=168276 RepID=A0A1G6MLL1_9NOCA|nr:hypothetical protein [Rhodococcus tukisamuensis]SDC56361.1 hypothetical protein SAMN05444580_101226 [Rhodococcus tukisamuensis]
MNKHAATIAGAFAAGLVFAGAGTASAAQTVAPGEGTYLVGAELAPGQYTASGQVDDYMGCYWKRLSGTTGEIDDIIASDYTHSEKVIVTVLPSDYAFESEYCGTWTRIGDIPVAPGPDLTSAAIGSAVVGSAVVGSAVLPLAAPLLMSGSAGL